MIPKGTLLIIGGAEDIGEEDDLDKNLLLKAEDSKRYEILRDLLASSRNKKIEIITSGSQFQNEVRNRYKRAFNRIGYPNPGFIPIKNRSEANNQEYVKRINHAGAVFFTGGDQFRLSTILGGSSVIDIIHKRYLEDKNFLVAGTSAGAMVMSEVMIIEGGKREALLECDLKTSAGLSIISNCIIDTHFIKRGRFGRLANAIINNPMQLGIGLGEDTALIIKKGDKAECRGSGMVVIIDGKNIGQTNITDAQENEPIFVENLIVHLLVKGCRFSIKKRLLATPAISKQNQIKNKKEAQNE